MSYGGLSSLKGYHEVFSFSPLQYVIFFPCSGGAIPVIREYGLRGQL
jgi:hypothetical protein